MRTIGHLVDAHKAQDEAEHQQLKAAQPAQAEREAKASQDEQAEPPEEDDDGQELEQIDEMIEAAVTPLSDNLDKLIEAMQGQAAGDVNRAPGARFDEPEPAAQKPAAPGKRSVVIKRYANTAATAHRVPILRR